ncbi:unnamed protein product [Fraxinus pennsylvanica]|uniref:Reverse transcriptase zinc-binding domain-containing protein n=1 Tax=Fraxinus pennsylvanica TaxID=56036 RepID=A0AAD1YS50_9LAMI|nr:unnamed protein product [Fraxinus pennsylvanica]
MIIHGSRLNRQAKVPDIVEGDDWRWPLACSPALFELMQSTLDTFRPDSTREDILRWVENVHGVFSVQSAWEPLRLRCPRVTWHHIVWFPKCITHQAFILWLVIQDGLYTQLKLLRFGLLQSMHCVLCGCSVKDLDHLFLSVHFLSAFGMLCMLNVTCLGFGGVGQKLFLG